MPLYRFECQCGRKVDEFRKIAERDNAPECHGPMVRKIMPTMVQADIQPYRSVAVDKETGKPVVVNSRRQHREFLKRNDYVEVPEFKPTKRDWNDSPDAPMVDVDTMKRKGWVEETL